MGKQTLFNIGDIIKPKTEDFCELLLIVSKENDFCKAIYITGDNDRVKEKIYNTDFYQKVENIFQRK